MQEINPAIFKEYDVRGRYPEELNEEVFYRIAAAFCQYLDQKKHFGPVVVGFDARISSPSLAEAFRQGVLDQGRDAVDIGITTTPLFYFSFNELKAAGGAMITASHNPGDFNGIKFLKEGGEVVYEKDGFGEIKKLLEEKVALKINKGRVIKKDFSENYISFLLNYAKIKGSLKVVADTSNGSAGPVLEKFLDRVGASPVRKTADINNRDKISQRDLDKGLSYGIETEKLFFEPDGNFPNHPPNPLLAEARIAAEAKVKEFGADLGFIVDADGDRIIFIDEKGETVESSFIYAFLLDNFAETGDVVLGDVSLSKIIEDVAKKKGVRFERVPVGYTNIKTAMRAKSASFGGEISGHFYFRDFFYSDSALLTLAHILTLVSGADKPISELLAPYQKYFHSGALNFAIKNPAVVIERLKKEYADGNQSFLDGLTVEYDSWWFNIRASKTEPLVRLVVEAESKELMKEKTKELTEIIKSATI